MIVVHPESPGKYRAEQPQQKGRQENKKQRPVFPQTFYLFNSEHHERQVRIFCFQVKVKEFPASAFIAFYVS